ncbi:MAG: M23 family metallopeptidase [Pseudobdellovibrionaceae bacterium]
MTLTPIDTTAQTELLTAKQIHPLTSKKFKFSFYSDGVQSTILGAFCILLLTATTLSLGSCASFHTPLSRELLQQQQPGSPSATTENGDGKTSKKTAGLGIGAKSNRAPAGADSESAVAFDWPVDEARMTRGFLPQKRRPHLGIDLAAPKGTPILASHQGLVIYAGRDFRGFGKMILIESGYGWATLYAHLDKILVSEGQRVAQGDVLGGMGRTGRATGYHLHFEIRKERGPVNPLPLLPNGSSLAIL